MSLIYGQCVSYALSRPEPCWPCSQSEMVSEAVAPKETGIIMVCCSARTMKGDYNSASYLCRQSVYLVKCVYISLLLSVCIFVCTCLLKFPVLHSDRALIQEFECTSSNSFHTSENPFPLILPRLPPLHSAAPSPPLAYSLGANQHIFCCG